MLDRGEDRVHIALDTVAQQFVQLLVALKIFDLGEQMPLDRAADLAEAVGESFDRQRGLDPDRRFGVWTGHGQQ
ncbi:hypothetical protein FMUAM8_24470 [Nocardia cyriacigeorgica]|nr:hypothetical protein FMUAM8_24470 [Nocardia cyriacigeorgica]